ncbi:MAG: lysophospholipid acyltransferase family protein [Phycisphaerales bacterium]
MARNESAIVNALAYGGVRGLGILLSQFTVDQNMAVIGRVGDMWFERDVRRRTRALGNIRRSLPHLSEAEALELTRLSMRHLLQMFVVEIFTAPRLITPSTWHRYVRFGEVDEALRILASGCPALFITGHCGNFEVLGFTLATVGYPLTALARPLDLPRVSDWLFDIRQRRGMKIMTKFGAMEKLPGLIESGEHVAFIADQNAGDRGLFVPFFGRLASAYKSIGLLAIRYNAPIVCGHAKRIEPDHFRYEINAREIIRPEEWTTQPDPLFYVTARYNRAMENMVREAPAEYFWVHRRWKSRPRHEREARPFPSSLRRRLEQLPWMTPAELDRIMEQSAIDTADIQTRRRERGG